jgi:RimJ/RimL family protein N-acetyltransferase
VLRRWTDADVDVLDAAVRENLEHLRPYLAWVAAEPLGLAGRRAVVAAWHEAWLRGGDGAYGMFEPERSGDRPLGGCGLHARVGPGGREIGYWVDHRSLGRGLARRAAAALTAAAFALDDVDHVEIHHDLTNVWSRRVPEALGFAHVSQTVLDRALAPAETGIELIWRTTRAERR